MKLGLAEVYRKASELRDKETALRAENRLLRKRLGSAQREQRSGSGLAGDN
jgi:regulator of replication initiation timing